MSEAVFGKIQVSKSHVRTKGRGEPEVISLEEENIDIVEVPYFAEGTHPARVSVGMEYSRQIRQYEPLKISVHVSMPCHANESDIYETYSLVSSMCSSKMAEAKQSVDELVKNA